MINHMKRRLHSRVAGQSGFTLVEIAIVLVIIGLLLGGVLKGQELIKNAKVKAYKSTFESISTAYVSYIDRYKTIPGDDAGATARFPVATFPNIVNGDGNGSISGYYASATLNDESNQAVIHLMAAGLIKGNPNAASAAEIRPKGPSGESLGIQVGGWNLIGTTACFSFVNGEMAELVDMAFDDGKPGSGSIRVATTTADSYVAWNANYKTITVSMCTPL